jgi:hypothetical protein
LKGTDHEQQKTVFRLHPTVNFARFGTSEDYYLSPETSAGLPQEGSPTTGGLPIKKGSESETIDSADLRDAAGHLKRQAARFRLYAYDFDGCDHYPNQGGSEITIGSVVDDGRTVKDILWTVHLANKKANAYMVVNSEGLAAYADGKVPQLRNGETYGTVDSPARLSTLMTDPGPRTVSGTNAAPVNCGKDVTASYGDAMGKVQMLPEYPQKFPADTYDPIFQPSGPLDTLGQILTDDRGRLLILPGYGRTAAWYDEYGDPMPLTGDLNNEGWFDDAADGPVSATLILSDPGGTESVEQVFGAWVVCGDPAYAPQIRNVVSVWDDVYDSWVRSLDLQPEIFDCATGTFKDSYKPDFESQIRPVFRAATMQQWTANLPDLALHAHKAIDDITADVSPDRTLMAGLTFLRNPNVEAEHDVGVPLMPLSLGDAGKPFLSVSKTQYFFLEQWSKSLFVPTASEKLGPGEVLDMASLSNCLGGRYVPGIEVSYPIRQPDIYITEWKTSGSGPFRVRHKALDYAKATQDTPFLSGGWIPLHDMTDGLEPGDMSKFMSVPWQTDYNSCSIHQTSINTAGANVATGNPSTLYWSWPSQRPDAVYVAAQVVDNILPKQVWSIRGPGTYAVDPKTSATFQKPLQAVTQWDRIGIVIQGSAIAGEAVKAYSPELYLEVQSQLGLEGTTSAPVPAWPFNASVKPSKT